MLPPFFKKRNKFEIDVTNMSKLISYNGSHSKKKHFLDYIIPPDTLGAKIKNLRLKQGLTFKEFTKRLKVSKDSTWRFEKNITIPNEKILKYLLANKTKWSLWMSLKKVIT
jgi:DNA-binding transcriptional regulator YiaG